MRASDVITIIILFFILLNIAAAGENGIIRVETESGLPVPGAHVYNHGIELGITGPEGILSVPIEELRSESNLLGRLAAITACYRGQCKGGATHGGGEFFNLLSSPTDPLVVIITDGCGFHSPEEPIGKILPIDSCPEETTDPRPNVPTSLSQFKLDGSRISVGAQIVDRSVAFKAKVSNTNGKKLRLQVELRRLDEYGGQFDDSKDGLKKSDLVESGEEATAYAYGLINGYYHWRARVIDEGEKTSDWVDFGNNQGADFIVYSNIVEPPNKSLDLDLTIRDGSTTNGQTLPGVRVTGHDGAGKSFTQITNSNGLTAIKGSPGTWHFEASKNGYETRNWDWEITASESRRYFLFTSQTSRIEEIGFYLLFFEESLNGQRLPGVRITGQDGKGKKFDKTATATGGGIYLEGSPGTWHFEASKDGYQTNTWDQEITGRVGPINAFLVKNSEIPPPKSENLMLYLTVHDGSIYGQTLPGVRVTGLDGAGKSFDQTTNQNGIVVLKGSPGTWHFEASKDGYQTETWDQELISSANRDAFLVKITERPPPKIEDIDLYLTVHEGSIYGQTLPGVRVTGWDGAGKNFDQITRSGPIDGIVVLKGSPGTWHFEASKDGYQTNTWDQELISSANRDAFLVKSQIQDTTLVGCHEDPSTGQVICSDDASVFSKGPIAQPLSDEAVTYATYCTNQGYNYQNGQCIFSDGTSCDAGAFYRGECEYSPQSNNEPFQPQPGCMRDPATGQMICMDDFSGASQQQPLVGPAPKPYPAYGY